MYDSNKLGSNTIRFYFFSFPEKENIGLCNTLHPRVSYEK